jgi:hypothetical protein
MNVTQGGRSEVDIRNEYESALRTIAARKSRLPATADALAYSESLDAVAATLTVCVQADNPGVLVGTVDELDVAEAALEAARESLKASLDEFLGMDTAASRPQAALVPQIVTLGTAVRVPTATDAK